jgi:hypothetical protein
MFACREHWYKLRKALRDAIWREYRRGQEIDKRPSWRYLAVQQRAVAELAFKPHDEEAAYITATYLLNSERCRKRAIEEGHGDPLEGLDPVPIDKALSRVNKKFAS